MAYIRCGTGGGSIDEKPQLLWSNANPTSAFAAQTVSLDLSSYKTIAIKYKTQTSRNETTFCFYANPCSVVKPAAYKPFIGIPTVSSDGKYRTSLLRVVTIADTGVTFGTAYSYQYTDTKYAIPLEIYGIKSQIYPDEE